MKLAGDGDAFRQSKDGVKQRLRTATRLGVERVRRSPLPLKGRLGHRHAGGDGRRARQGRRA